MLKVMFVCHGNICRSTMAEFMAKKHVKDNGLNDKFYFCSSATSTEELGNSVHYGTARVLDRLGITDYKQKRAVQIKKSQYDDFDLFVCMDSANVRNLTRIFGGDEQGKIKLLLSYADLSRDVADPWYTGDFDSTYRDVKIGLDAFFKQQK